MENFHEYHMELRLQCDRVWLLLLFTRPNSPTSKHKQLAINRYVCSLQAIELSPEQTSHIKDSNSSIYDGYV